MPVYASGKLRLQLRLADIATTTHRGSLLGSAKAEHDIPDKNTCIGCVVYGEHLQLDGCALHAVLVKRPARNNPSLPEQVGKRG